MKALGGPWGCGFRIQPPHGAVALEFNHPMSLAQPLHSFWGYRVNEHEYEQAPGAGEGQGNLASLLQSEEQ